MSGRPGPTPTHRRPGFWTAVVVGGALMAWGSALFLDATPDARRRLDFAAWLVGLDIVHDAIVAPLMVVVGAALARLVRGPARAPVQAGAIASGFVLVVALPPLLDTASRAHNPTIQPLDYTTSTVTVLAVVWAVTGAWALLRHSRRGPAGRRQSEDTKVARVR